MAILLNINLKSDMWNKHKQVLAASPTVGDKVKLLEAAAAKAADNDPQTLQEMDAAVTALQSAAQAAQQKAKGVKTTPPATAKYLADMVAKAAELKTALAAKIKTATAEEESNESNEEEPAKTPQKPSTSRPLPKPPTQSAVPQNKSTATNTPTGGSAVPQNKNAGNTPPKNPVTPPRNPVTPPPSRGNAAQEGLRQTKSTQSKRADGEEREQEDNN